MGRTVAELLADLATPPGRMDTAEARESSRAALNRRSALAGAALFSFGCNFVNASPGDAPVLVDGWLVRPSDIKPSACG